MPAKGQFVMLIDDFHAANERWRAERLAAYKALPPIKRIEHWYAETAMIDIGISFSILGEALREWAVEQQAKAPTSPPDKS